jgi:hypothetical protein
MKLKAAIEKAIIENDIQASDIENILQALFTLMSSTSAAPSMRRKPLCPSGEAEEEFEQ